MLFTLYYIMYALLFRCSVVFYNKTHWSYGASCLLVYVRKLLSVHCRYADGWLNNVVIIWVAMYLEKSWKFKWSGKCQSRKLIR